VAELAIDSLKRLAAAIETGGHLSSADLVAVGRTAPAILAALEHAEERRKVVRVATADAIAAAMQAAWDDFVGDTGDFPDCLSLRGSKLFADFRRGNFAFMVATHLRVALPDGSPTADVNMEALRRLESLIQRVLDDDETGRWGPDVTMVPVLREARDIAGEQMQAVLAALERISELERALAEEEAAHDKHLRQAEKDVTALADSYRDYHSRAGQVEAAAQEWAAAWDATHGLTFTGPGPFPEIERRDAAETALRATLAATPLATSHDEVTHLRGLLLEAGTALLAAMHGQPVDDTVLDRIEQAMPEGLAREE